MSEDQEQESHFISEQQYRQKTADLFRLCEEWSSGRISAGDFLVQRQASTKKPSMIANVSHERSLELSEEFLRALSCAVAIENAICEMERQGVGKSPSSCLRAFYFASQVADPADILALQACIFD